MAFAFDRGAAVAQERELAHRAQPAAPLAGAGHVLAQLVTQHAQRQVGLDVLDRVVAGVGVERVDGVHAVLALPAAIGALEDLHMYPVRLVLQA